MTPVDLEKLTMSVQIMNVTSQHLSMCSLSTYISTGKNAEVRKLQASKRYGTQISLNMTLELTSQVKVYLVGMALKFSGRMQNCSNVRYR